MNSKARILAARIESQVSELVRLATRAQEGWIRAKSHHDDHYIDGVALNLHGFYSGLERVFEKIAAQIDGAVPTTANWHKELLEQMSIELPGVRPAVISLALCDRLEEYRGFRHVVRNVYAFHLHPEKMEHLVTGLDSLLCEIKNEIGDSFVKFIEMSE